MEDYSIHITDLYKRYGKSKNYSLNNINLIISHHDRFGILGPNGAGKTTLISIICGALNLTRGKVKYFLGDTEIDLNSFKKITGYVPQEYAFYQELTPIQNLQYFGAMYNLSGKEIKENSIEVLDNLGLTNVADKKINTFSGGMKRRMNLAIGIIHKPNFLFLDEPTVGVDVQSRNAILKFLIDLNNQGTTIVYTSHILSEAEQFCNNIALIDNGKIVEQNSIVNLLKQYNQQDLESLFITLTGADYRDV